jgi:hypothetical protein
MGGDRERYGVGAGARATSGLVVIGLFSPLSDYLCWCMTAWGWMYCVWAVSRVTLFLTIRIMSVTLTLWYLCGCNRICECDIATLRGAGTPTRHT